AANYPTLPSVMHSVINSYKNIISVALETEYSFPEVEELKDRIANPDAYASAAPAAGGGGGGGDAAPAEEAKKEESEAEESDEGNVLCQKSRWIWLTINRRLRWIVRLNSLNLVGMTIQFTVMVKLLVQS